MGHTLALAGSEVKRRGLLTVRERAFVTAYLGPARGNGKQAALLAGYAPKNAAIQASQLLTRLNVRNALEKALEKVERAAIADAVERDELLTGILRNPFLESKTRMRAIAELNKVEGRHIARHKIEGKLTLEVSLGLSRELDAGE